MTSPNLLPIHVPNAYEPNRDKSQGERLRKHAASPQRDNEKEVPTGLAEKVYLHVRESIRSGKLLPNARLTQRGLCAELKVSQVTVREAFERLEQQGWIERNRNHSVAVKSFTEKDRSELYWLREMIEVAAVQHVAQRATDEQLAELRSVLDTLSYACDTNDVELYQEADIRFHRTLVNKVGNARLRAFYETMAEQIRRLMMVGAMKVAFNWTQSCEVMEPISHEKIYLAIANHDECLAAELLRKHIRFGHEVIEMVNRARNE